MVRPTILTETWALILNHHIYEADALQIATCMQSQSNALVSSDRRLVQISRKTGLEAFHIVNDEEKINSLLKR